MWGAIICFILAAINLWLGIVNLMHGNEICALSFATAAFCTFMGFLNISMSKR